MSKAEREVYCIPDKLGTPIPLDDHAVSVALPLWAHVVGYEEGDEEVLKQMFIGYPRFKIHLYVEMLMDHYTSARNNSCQSAEEEEACLIFPSTDTAERCADFLERHAALQSIKGAVATLVPTGYFDTCVVFFPRRFRAVAKAFWQHCGEILSSRTAYDLLIDHLGLAVESATGDDLSARYVSSGCCEGFSDHSAERGIKSHIAGVLQIDACRSEELVSLTASGMAAIYSSFRLAREHHRETFGESNPHMVVFGFPYLDTLKLLGRGELNEGGVSFFGRADEADMAQLQLLLERRNSAGTAESRIGAVFAEFPSNPLLRVCDLRRLSELCVHHDCLLVVDDTIGNFANVDLLHGGEGSGVVVDLLCTSLTKTYSGRGDVLAGSLVVNPVSRHSCSMLAHIKHLKLSPLYKKDVATLVENSKDFLQRTAATNRGAAALAAFLQGDPAVGPLVERVYYPSGSGSNSDWAEAVHRSLLRKPSNMTQQMRDQGFEAGFGCLLSVVFREEVDVTLVYDNLALHKGPSLGTNYSLVSPYTLLAHYFELEWAESFGVSRRLLRVSVGTEDAAYLQQRFLHAVSVACSAGRLNLTTVAGEQVGEDQE